jgi:hypothetical protein
MWEGLVADVELSPANELSKPCALVYPIGLLEPHY